LSILTQYDMTPAIKELRTKGKQNDECIAVNR